MDSKVNGPTIETYNMTGSKHELVTVDHIVFEEGGCIHRRTKVEKILFVILLLVVAVVIGLVVTLLVTKDNKDICLTKDCINTAAMINEALDYTVEPCDDFYEFACGNWKRKYIIPEDKTSFGTVNQLFDKVNVDLKNALEKKNTPDDSQAVVKARLLYASCMNLTRIKNDGAVPLLSFLTQLGGWPVIRSGWTDSDFDLVEVMRLLTLYNSFQWDNLPVLSTSVAPDSKQPTKHIIQIDQASYGMPGEKYYFKGRNDKMVEAYEHLAVQVAVLLGANKTTAEEDMKDMVDFEINLVNISLVDDKSGDLEARYNKMNISNLHLLYPQYNWLKYFQGIFHTKNIEINITGSEPVINETPEYLQKLFPLLSNTSKRVIANYIGWRVVQTYLDDLTEELQDLNVDYQKIIFGTTTTIPRWKKCAEYTKTLKLATGRLFIDETFNPDAKETILEMIENLRSAFKDQLQSNDWMNEETRIAAREKADAIVENVAYPDDILDNNYLNNLYKYYEYDDNYFLNIQQTEYQETITQLSQLREPVVKTSWFFSPATVNANYYPSNYMEFPAAILQPRFYSKSFPKSVNYGGIGLVIGHEITHGFDNKGRQYDKNGNLRQWWTDDVIARFNTHAQCVIDQYSSFTVPEIGLNINGASTLSENIADMGGLKQTYRAYRKWVKENGEEPRLPSLNFNHDQLLFINFAQSFCVNMRPEEAKQRILTEQHAPNKFRVIGACQNSEDFARSFKCPINSYMNPKHKCSLW